MHGGQVWACMPRKNSGMRIGGARTCVGAVLTDVMPTNSCEQIRALLSTKSMKSRLTMRLAGVCNEAEWVLLDVDQDMTGIAGGPAPPCVPTFFPPLTIETG